MLIKISPCLGVTNLLVAIDKILKMEESQNADEIESALETLGLIGTSKSCFCLIYWNLHHVARTNPYCFFDFMVQ
jgi:hypothetical protein